jgi:hypothetical protein
VGRVEGSVIRHGAYLGSPIVEQVFQFWYVGLVIPELLVEWKDVLDGPQ